MSDKTTVNAIEALLGRSVQHRFEGESCVSLALTDDTVPLLGLLRHASDDLKWQILLLVARLEQLEELDLRQNWLRRLPEEIGNLKSMRVLDLASNYLGQIPHWLFTLEKLERLNLGVNDLTTIPPDISRLSKLEALWIHKNAISALPEEIGCLKGLGTLNLYLNRFPDFPSQIWQLPAIHTFAWGLSNVDYVPEEFSAWRDLRFLSLVACKILSIDRLAANKELSGVRVHKNQISVLGEELCDLPKLRQVTFYQNNLDRLPAGFERLDKLEMVNVAWNRFSRFPQELFRLPRLRWAAVHDNPFPPPELPRNEGCEFVTVRPFFSDKQPIWNRLDYM